MKILKSKIYRIGIVSLCVVAMLVPSIAYQFANPYSGSVEAAENKVVGRTARDIATERIGSKRMARKAPEVGKTEFTVHKVWSDGNDSHNNDRVLMQLYRDGQHYQNHWVSKSDKWHFTFTGLPYSRANGTPYEYYVKEQEVDGYDADHRPVKTNPGHKSGDITYERVNFNDIKPEDELIMVASDDYSYNSYIVEPELERHNAEIQFRRIRCEKRAEIEGDTLRNSTDKPKWKIRKAGGNKFRIFAENTYLDNELVGENPSQAFRDDTLFIYENDGKIKNQENSKYLINYRNRLNIKSEDSHSYRDTSFEFFKKVSRTSNPTYSQTIYNDKISVHKRIDALKDNKQGTSTKNKDTNVNGRDDYRLYLDVDGGVREQPIDVLLVVDNTSSMTRKTKFHGRKVERQFAANELVNGNGSTNDSHSHSDGLISQLMNINKNNKIACITYCGSHWSENNRDRWPEDKNKYSAVTMPWTSLSSKGSVPYSDVRHKSGAGTNYSSALLRADEYLNHPDIKNDGRQKYMLFISDGEPNCYMKKIGSDKEERYEWVTSYYSAIKDDVINFYNGFFKTNNPEVTTYTIGIKDPDGKDDYSILKTMAQAAGGRYYLADSGDKLKEAFENIKAQLYPANVKIKDELSKYVDMNINSSDLKVTRTYRDMDGRIKTETVWQENAKIMPGRIGHAVGQGASYIESVTYEPSSSNDSTGTVKLNFKAGYSIGADNKFTISYNVKANEAARKALVENDGKYLHKGDKDTDYPDTHNNTSSGKQGLYSNKVATVEYSGANGKGVSKKYPKPVIQANIDLIFKKIDSADKSPLQGVKFKLYKAELSNGIYEGNVGGWNLGSVIKTDLVTGADGTVKLSALDRGYYVLEETQAKQGYVIKENAKRWYISFTENKGLSIYDSAGHKFDKANTPADGKIFKNVFYITNSKIYKLPATGGIGVYWYYLIGAYLVAMALLLMYKKIKKMQI